MFLNDLGNLGRGNVLGDITNQIPGTWGQIPVPVNTWGQFPYNLATQIPCVTSQIPYGTSQIPFGASQIPFVYNYPYQVTGQFPFHFGMGHNVGVPFTFPNQMTNVQLQQPFHLFGGRFIPTQNIGVHPFGQFLGQTGLYGQNWNTPVGFQGTFCR